MIKGVLIDIDNTIYSYKMAHEPAIIAVTDFMKNYVNEDDFITCYNRARNFVHENLKNTASSHNRLLYFQKTLENLGLKDYILAKKMYDIYWSTFLENMILFDGVIDFFEEFSSDKLCFVTDLTAYIQYRKIEKFGLSKYVTNLVTSEEAGVEKPNKKIFEMAIEKLNLPVNEICMIGDSYEKDYLGASNLGIKAFLFNPENKILPSEIEQYNDYTQLKEFINEK